MDESLPEYDVLDDDTVERVKQISDLIDVILHASKYNITNCTVRFNDMEITISKIKPKKWWLW
jgi:hypothetical protein